MVHIQDLTFTYNGCSAPALSEISLDLPEGTFSVLAGPSGSGKTTLLRLLKKELAPYGTSSGDLQIGNDGFVGFVMQNPDNQIVTDKVWHELTFAGENLGLPEALIQRRVGEIAAYFGIDEWLSKDTHELSGGQKQILNLAAVMVCDPRLLLLDEPTAMLDPIAADNFLALLRKIHQELGVTILMVEHRLDGVLALSDRVLVMEKGKIAADFKPTDFLQMSRAFSSVASVLPETMQLYRTLGLVENMPLTVGEGRTLIRKLYPNLCGQVAVPEKPANKNVCVEVKNVSFRYARTSPDVLRDFSLTVYSGECYCLVGGNGVGKSTLLKLLSGVAKPYRGCVRVQGAAAMLPQNPKLVFLSDTLQGDYESYLRALGRFDENSIRNVAAQLGISHLLSRHPYDLSGGEQQKAALGKCLLAGPQVLLLDEPTKGLDLAARKALGEIIIQLKQTGVCVILVTHDLDFCSQYADRCGFLSNGKLIAQGEPHDFFTGNRFYTTAAHRIGRDVCKNGITPDEIGAFFMEQGVRR
ncbi:MAG: ATP-binding cassette domain-containing protein [Clostridia bacterium]|nr:ATP-binding cassette domain-containing protein [Clostridia bacterium]